MEFNPFHILDVFTEKKYTSNQLAVVIEARRAVLL
jgi:predicted PhzF superfamily epimerase YddE/YHI9